MLKEDMYRLKKIIKTLAPTGTNPLNWGMEVCAKVIQRQRANQIIKPGTEALLNWRLQTLVESEAVSIENFSVSKDEFDNKPECIKSILEKYGVCVINNFVAEQDAFNASIEMFDFFSSGAYENARNSTAREFADEANFIWQTDYAWSKNYIKLSSADKPVVNIRARDENVDDSGMVDIFNVQKLAVSATLEKIQACLDAMNSEYLQSLLSEYSGYSLRQSNLYHNKAVTRTRGPHIDNNSDPYKLFLYLTDVQEAHNGPYCYLPSSPKDRSYMTIERLRNAVLDLPSTEVSSFPREKMTKLFGKAGTAIITNQSGIHCGWPQSEDGERMLLVSNYY